MTYFCPVCWCEIPSGTNVCPQCHADLLAADAKTFVEKLRLALNHPEPQTSVRAAWILGERGEKSAVDDLIRALDETQDSFLAEAVVEALGKIGDLSASEALIRAAKTGTARVRRAARRAIDRVPPVSTDLR